MLLEIFIFFEIVTIVLFMTAFFTKQEIIWTITAVFSGVLMFTAYHVEYYVYQYNASIVAYSPVMLSHSYPYLSGLNFIFFSLSLALGLFDLFDKYGANFKFKSKKGEV